MELVWGGRGLVCFKYLPRYFLERLRKTMEALHQNKADMGTGYSAKI
jgi:hypothetical protein